MATVVAALSPRRLRCQGGGLNRSRVCRRKCVMRAAASGNGTQPPPGGDSIPPGCSRYIVELKKPVGLVLEEGKEGGIFVSEIVSEGNAYRDGRVSVGDELIATSAIVFNSYQTYNDVQVKSGEEVIRLAVRGESFNTIMAAIGTNPGHRPVKFEFQKCQSQDQ